MIAGRVSLAGYVTFHKNVVRNFLFRSEYREASESVSERGSA